METLLGVLFLGGAALAVSAIYPLIRPFPYATGRGRALRLKSLSEKLTVHLETSADCTAKCYSILRVLVGTTPNGKKAIAWVAFRDPGWKRARQRVLRNARRGRWVARRLIRQEPEPGVVLARQCFRAVSEICSHCPMLQLDPKDLPKRCPSMDTFGGES